MLVAVLTVTLLAGCGTGSTDTAQSADEDSDSVVAAVVDSADTVPQIADLVFDDFLYRFTHDSRFQLLRINFPLPLTQKGRERHLTQKDWKFDPLHARKDVFTMLWRSQSDRRTGSDSLLSAASFEWVYLDKNITKTYDFKKIGGRWMLTAVRWTPLAASPEADFWLFYRQFSEDPDYQQEHLASPISFVTYDYDNFEKIDGVIYPEQWEGYRPEMPTGILTNVNYGGAEAPESTSTRILTMQSQSGGLSCSFTFRKAKSGWQLSAFRN